MIKYYLKINGKKNNTASSKAKIDIENILSKINFKPLFDNNISTFKTLITAIRIIFERDVFVVLQYPFIGKKFLFLNFLKKFKNIKLIFFIHDINSLRNTGDRQANKIDEIKLMNLSDCIISHNDKMTKWLISNGVKTKIVNLEIFDYLSDKTSSTNYLEDFKQVYFAGNLDENKSKFLYTSEIKKLNFKMNIYGPNYNKFSNNNNNIKYKGCFSPEDLAQELNNGFGLIWDGTSIDKCDGINGNYLRYNNPHKTSLYLASGLPVIIWKEAALADFVNKYKVGFTVDSLSEIENALNDMSLEEYRLLKTNCEKMKNKLLNGIFTINAMEKAIRELK